MEIGRPLPQKGTDDMGAVTSIDFDQPDETRAFPHGRWDVVHVGESTVARGTLEPGWHWENDVKPIVGTDSCQQRHVGFMVSGQLQVTMQDGSEATLTPGQAYIIEPGHDAWTVGEEAVVAIEYASRSAASYATRDPGGSD
jgi:hypothetical protein